MVKLPRRVVVAGAPCRVQRRGGAFAYGARMDDLDGRVAVVTGAASGIGFAIARELAGAGVRVVMTDVNADRLAAATAEVRAGGGVVEGVEADVRDPMALERAAARAVDQFGALHIAVNNAGIVNGGPIWELSLEEWHRVIDVDLWGVIHGVRAFVPRIVEAGAGHVVNIASMAAMVPHAGIGPYTVAKHGVLGLSEVLKAEIDAGGLPIGVSVVLPGMFKTSMSPSGGDPTIVAICLLDAIRRSRFYVFTDDYRRDEVDARLEAMRAALGEVPRY
jgi:NAD(P)-dependent dehydrogenase (short-subunit alcohol dehydrogenase family)